MSAPAHFNEHVSGALIRLATPALITALCSCSILLGENDPPDLTEMPQPPEDCAYSTTDSSDVVVLEGEGATRGASQGESFEWTARPRLIHVTGDRLPTGNETVLFSRSGPVEILGATFNGAIGVLEVAFPIDRTRPEGSDEAQVSADLFAFSVEEETCVRLRIQATFLPELIGPIEVETTAPRYSLVDVRAVTFLGDDPIELRSSSAIIFGGSLIIAGDRAATGNPGPGGGIGGPKGADGTVEPSGGKGALVTDGGGAGHAAFGSPGRDGTVGGEPSGHLTLLRQSALDPRGGHGGGGPPTGFGGGGGGALFAHARSALLKHTNSAEADGLIDASGGRGSAGAGEMAGGGSGGTVFLSAPSVAAGLALNVDVSGGGMSSTTQASGGRLRVDAPGSEIVFVDSTMSSSFFRGAILASPPLVVRGANPAVNLNVIGGYDALKPTELGSVSVRVRSLASGRAAMPVREEETPPNFFATLEPGVSEVCIDTLRHTTGVSGGPPAIAVDDMVGSICVEIAYVP